jgi:nicotinate-nucleotide--dimethylbenzimidazole phosphoribosyltransferase
LASAIAPPDPAWACRAAAYQDTLTMPRGALGRVLELARQLCAIQGTLTPSADPAAVAVFAADHGVADEGVSAYPREVTAQMVANFLRGGAAVNVLARRLGVHVVVADLGVCAPVAAGVLPAGTSYVEHTSVARGTASFLRSPAMTRDQAHRAIETGRRIFREELAPRGVRTVILGEMGIGNTTSAAALTAALTGLPAAAVTGRGSGVDDEGLRRKAAVVEQALALHFSNRGAPPGPLEALEAVGGFEIAGLAGVALEAAARGTLVLLDGFISSAAGLVAAQLDPALKGYLVAGHRGPEPGHRAVLDALGLEPLLELDMRLGEGTGACLALPLVRAAADVMREMATFASAGVSDRP